LLRDLHFFRRFLLAKIKGEGRIILQAGSAQVVPLLTTDWPAEERDWTTILQRAEAAVLPLPRHVKATWRPSAASLFLLLLLS